jgi:hypothetical protein
LGQGEPSARGARSTTPSARSTSSRPSSSWRGR